MRRYFCSIVLACLMTFGAVSNTRADFLFSFANAERAASVNFHVDNALHQLVVTLTNTSGFAIPDSAHVLTGVFFNMTGNPGLGSVSAVLGGGSNVANGGTTDPDNVVGGEWAYLGGGDILRNTQRQGISSAGLGVFGDPTFPGNNLNGPDAIDGIQYGIANASYVNGQGNGGIETTPLIRDSVVFTLSGLPVDFNGSFSDVLFQYGTALTEPSFPPEQGPGVPAPAGVILLGLGGAMTGVYSWRQRKRFAAA
jgi:hypothetical protein